MSTISRRSTRIKACELAAQCMHGQCGPDNAIAGRMMALMVLFETYIDEGADETEKRMRLLSQRKVKNFKVIAGGAL